VHKDRHLKLKMARKYGTKLEAARREMLEARPRPQPPRARRAVRRTRVLSAARAAGGLLGAGSA